MSWTHVGTVLMTSHFQTLSDHPLVPNKKRHLKQMTAKTKTVKHVHRMILVSHQFLHLTSYLGSQLT